MTWQSKVQLYYITMAFAGPLLVAMQSIVNMALDTCTNYRRKIFLLLSCKGKADQEPLQYMFQLAGMSESIYTQRSVHTFTLHLMACLHDIQGLCTL